MGRDETQGDPVPKVMVTDSPGTEEKNGCRTTPPRSYTPVGRGPSPEVVVLRVPLHSSRLPPGGSSGRRLGRSETPSVPEPLGMGVQSKILSVTPVLGPRVTLRSEVTVVKSGAFPLLSVPLFPVSGPDGVRDPHPTGVVVLPDVKVVLEKITPVRWGGELV